MENYMTTNNSRYREQVKPEFIPFIEKFHRMDCYGVDYFVLLDYSPNIDNLIKQSNWEIVTSKLKNIKGVEITNIPNSATKHFQMWVYPLQMEENSRNKILQEMERIFCALAEYPILNEIYYQSLQREQIYELWNSTEDGNCIDCVIDGKIYGDQNRLDICKEYGHNIFASRHAVIPGDLYEKIAEKYI